jgi:hypothetical protein
MDSIRKKAKERHAEEALKDMIPPQDPVSGLLKGKRDVEDLFRDSIKISNNNKEEDKDT